MTEARHPGRRRPASRPGRAVVAAVIAVGATAMVVAGLGGCTSASPAAADAPIDGRRLYLTCARSCHSPEPILDYSRQEWETILPEMSAEAKLTPARAEVLRAYVFGHFR